MKTIYSIILLCAFCVASQAASVRLYFVDPFTGDKDTNAFYITPVGTNVLSNGGVVTRGVTTKVTPASNGYATNTLAVGHYSVTNRALGSGVVIRVPDTSSFYDYTNLLVSGYNIFVTIENGSGSGTFQTNISWTAVTNLTSFGALTNNETRNVVFGGTITGNGSGLTNVPASSIVKYISQTKPVNADSNWFGPWTPGTVTAGIQEAWDSVVKPTNAGPTARGVVFQFEGGYYYFTNTLVFSNYWPMALTFRGANLLDTKLVYAGNENGTNTITFKGAGTPRVGSLNLPNHITITDMGFTAINDATNVLMKIGNFSHANLSRCNFTSWRVMTNQVEGAGVSTDTSSVGGVTSGNLVGLFITDGPEHSTVLDDIFFAGLATGADLRNDHVTAFGLKFAHIGIFANQWPATSRYSIGACIIQEQGLDSVFYYCHFYSAKVGFCYISDGGVSYNSPLLDHANFESISGQALVSSPDRSVVVRDPIEYGDTPGWDGLYVHALSNSPNWGVLSTIVDNSVTYGVDGSAAAVNGDAFKIRIGQTNTFLVSAEQVTLNTKLILSTPTALGEFNPDSAITIGDIGGSAYCTFGVNGTSESSVSHLTPKLIVGTPTITSGSGAPSASEPNGSIYMRTDGGASTTLYIRHSGTWLAK